MAMDLSGKKSRWLPATLFFASIAVTLFVVARRALRRARERKDPMAQSLLGFDENWGSAYPPAEGAVSAVTGGNPEDMNAMPATGDFEAFGPIFDGSQLRTDRRASTHS